MAEGLRGRVYRSGDEGEIVELLKTMFPDWARRRNAVDYWKWKYLAPPLGSVVSVACDGDKIVGVSHDIPLRIKLGVDTYLGSYGDDAVTHSSYQGKGVYRMVNELNREELEKRGVRVGYNVPTHPAFQRATSPNIHFLPHQILHLVNVLDAEAFIKGLKQVPQQLAKLGLRGAREIAKVRSPRVRSSETLISDATGFDVSADELWREIAGRLRFSVERSRGYLDWRYGDRRAGTFIIRQARDDGRLVGYAVAELREDDEGKQAYLQDILCVNDSTEVYRALIESLVEEMRRMGVNSVHQRVVEGQPLQAVLGSLGFIVLPGQQRIMVKVSLSDLPAGAFAPVDPSKPSEVHFTYGDLI